MLYRLFQWPNLTYKVVCFVAKNIFIPLSNKTTYHVTLELKNSNSKKLWLLLHWKFLLRLNRLWAETLHPSIHSLNNSSIITLSIDKMWNCVNCNSDAKKLFHQILSKCRRLLCFKHLWINYYTFINKTFFTFNILQIIIRAQSIGLQLTSRSNS